VDRGAVVADQSGHEAAAPITFSGQFGLPICSQSNKQKCVDQFGKTMIINKGGEQLHRLASTAFCDHRLPIKHYEKL
jgi:hypothetical protein